MADHISRKELKQDKIKQTLEHGAEAVYSHSQITLAILLVILVIVSGYGGWTIYHDRQTVKASADLDAALKTYSARIGVAGDPSEPVYSTESARAEAALEKFTATANKYPRTKPGKFARYYAALCLEDLERQNQALEELKKLSGAGDKEIAAMADYQTAVLLARTGKTDDAIKIYRALADKPVTLVPRPMVLLELAALLRQKNSQEALGIYQQIKKEFPDSTISEEADRGLGMLAPKS